jgi:hypothetical protein
MIKELKNLNFFFAHFVQQNREIPHPQQTDFRSRQARMNVCRLGRVLRGGVGTEPPKSTDFDIRE